MTVEAIKIYKDTYKDFTYIRKIILENLEPLGHQVLILAPIQSPITKGGIILPEQRSSYDEYVGTIIEFGPNAFKDEELFKAGIPKYKGEDITVGNHVTLALITKKYPVKIPAFEDFPGIDVNVAGVDDCYIKLGCSFEYLKASLCNPWS